MSEAGQGEREWRLYLDDMIAFAQKVQSYTDGLDQSGFLADGLTYDATLRNLELIGEAATRIPDAVRAAHPEIEVTACPKVSRVKLRCRPPNVQVKPW